MDAEDERLDYRAGHAARRHQMLRRRMTDMDNPLAQTTELKPRERVAVNVGAIRNGSSNNERNSSSHSKTLRAAMGFSLHSSGCVKRAKECWNESRTLNGSPRAAETKEKPAGVNRRHRGNRFRLPFFVRPRPNYAADGNSSRDGGGT
jgi:hypothetical protein